MCAGAAIVMSQEMYVINDETMLAAGWLGLMAIAVQGISSSVAETLDSRAADIEAELKEQRQVGSFCETFTIYLARTKRGTGVWGGS